MEKEIVLVDGVKLLVDDEKFNVINALSLAGGPTGDTRLTFDLTITDILEEEEAKVQSIVTLRTV